MYITPSGILNADVANGGTFTVALPAPYDAGSVAGALDHRLVINYVPYVSPVSFSVAVSGSTATVTNKSGGTWKAGSAFGLQLNQLGDAGKNTKPPRIVDRAIGSAVVRIIPIGAPVAVSATAVLTATTFASATSIAPTTAIVPGSGIGGRALKIISSSASDTAVVVTTTGKDVYGVVMSEALTTNGTTAVLGKKAFATVTSIATSAATVGTISVGTQDVFGLPIPLSMLGLIAKDLTDGATSGTAGTFVVADTTSGGPTTTTNDARGTYAPNTASNGTHYYHVIGYFPDALYPSVQA